MEQETFKVFDLSTDSEYLYQRSEMVPDAMTALMLCYLQAQGRYDTWSYPELFTELRQDVVQGRHGTLGLGDFAVCASTNAARFAA